MALIVSNLSVEFGGRRILDAVDARFEQGRIAVVMGPNGAGKSTLLRSAAGLTVGEGELTVDGRAVAALPPRERARIIGYLPQEHSIHWNVTARELVALGRAPRRVPFAGEDANDQAAIAEALAATDSEALADRRVLTLSGGERARVLLARVLASQPRWLLADEPLASLDPAHQLDLLDRLRAAADGGIGVVLVLHDLAQAARVADDIIVLDRGRVVARDLSAATISDVFGVGVAYADGLPVPTSRLGR